MKGCPASASVTTEDAMKPVTTQNTNANTSRMNAYLPELSGHDVGDELAKLERDLPPSYESVVSAYRRPAFQSATPSTSRLPPPPYSLLPPLQINNQVTSQSTVFEASLSTRSTAASQPSKYNFSFEFRKTVAQDYMNSNLSLKMMSEKWGASSASIRRWVQYFRPIEEEPETPASPQAHSASSNLSDRDRNPVASPQAGPSRSGPAEPAAKRSRAH